MSMILVFLHTVIDGNACSYRICMPQDKKQRQAMKKFSQPALFIVKDAWLRVGELVSQTAQNPVKYAGNFQNY